MTSKVCGQKSTEEAILRAVLYSDLFDYALTPAELARYLMNLPCTLDVVRDSLSSPVWLNGRVSQVDGFVTLRGRETLVGLRRRREKSSRGLWKSARRFARVLTYLPFVRMIGVTGALSMDNSSEGDDVDVMIVTVPGRVWLTRALSIGVVLLGRLGGRVLCPNYVISENVLALEPKTLFVAHEFAQMVPVYGLGVWAKMCDANPWIWTILPNARTRIHREAQPPLGLIGRWFRALTERMLSGRLGDRIEAWEMQRKISKFQPLAGPKGSVILDRDHVKGHFNDHGAVFDRRYGQKLSQFQLNDESGRGPAPAVASPHPSRAHGA